MTQEEKSLLLKDLCARLPYNVLVLNKDGDVESFTWQELKEFEEGYISKPYLRPMSSMTNVEVLEYISLKECIVASDDMTYYFETYESIDWLIAHHFDIRNLIEKSLALEAPEGMYK